MSASPDNLFKFLDDLEIDHETVEHEAYFTVEDGAEFKDSMPGAHTKNLFLKDKSGAYVLISAHADTEIRLNQLHKTLGMKRLSFGSAEDMRTLLGVVPGSVTAFALMNDTGGQVAFVLDRALLGFEVVNFHPLVNTATTQIATDALERFVQATGHQMKVIDFQELAAN